jgi:hypothetical protein
MEEGEVQQGVGLALGDGGLVPIVESLQTLVAGEAGISTV